ncbi:MAG: biotin--[acetyl-CoA-carboxylase] ligase [Pseudomonadota bacterium]
MSTNDEAKRLAQAGDGGNLIVWAKSQSGGRGRRGRQWTSPEGNLYCSFLLRPNCTIAEAPQIGFVAVLAVADVVMSHLGGAKPVQVKWPNDVLVDGRKVAGILLESQTRLDDMLDWLVVGQGVNLISHPGETLFPATNLRAEGAIEGQGIEADLALLGGRFAHWFDIWIASGFSALRDAWLARAYGLGREISLREPAVPSNGQFVDLDLDGAMVLEQPDGQRCRVTTGDVQVMDQEMGEP